LVVYVNDADVCDVGQVIADSAGPMGKETRQAPQVRKVKRLSERRLLKRSTTPLDAKVKVAWLLKIDVL
jgi:hypothetical protein